MVWFYGVVDGHQSAFLPPHSEPVGTASAMSSIGGQRRRAVIAAMCAVTAAFTGLASAAADPANPGSGSSLAALQLGSADIGPMIKRPGAPNPDLSVTQTLDAPIGGGNSTSNPQCAGAVYAGLDDTYAGSDFTGMNIQELSGTGRTKGSGEPIDYSVITVISGFDSEADATALVDKARDAWTGCHREKVTGDLTGVSQTRTVNMPISGANSITVVNNHQPGACSHAMASKGTVAVEVSACSSYIGLTDQGLKIALKTLDGVPQ